MLNSILGYYNSKNNLIFVNNICKPGDNLKKHKYMSQLFAERLKSARMMNGFSLQDLSDKLENRISRQAIHKYEKGEAEPDSEMLNFLCEVLDVRPGFFTRETLVELGTINFRKIEKLPSKEESAIIEKTRDFLESTLNSKS